MMIAIVSEVEAPDTTVRVYEAIYFFESKKDFFSFVFFLHIYKRNVIP